MVKLDDLLALLHKSGLDFVIVGGYAANLYGGTWATDDLDIALLMSPTNLFKLRRVLTPLHPKHRMNPKQKFSFVDVPDNFRGWKYLFLETDLGILDVTGDVTGIGGFARIRERSVLREIAGNEYRVISIEDLILAKRARKRESDLRDANELEALQKRASI